HDRLADRLPGWRARVGAIVLVCMGLSTAYTRDTREGADDDDDSEAFLRDDAARSRRLRREEIRCALRGCGLD
ncbi:MAG TPA: hypothetical protein VIO38_01030, partial [Rariglobus sp.]